MAKSLLVQGLFGGAVLVGGAVAAPAALEARAPAVALREHTLPLQRNWVQSAMGGQRPIHRKVAQALDVLEGGEPVASGSGVARNAYHGIEYITDVKAGVGTYQLIVDTGSSDTWIVKSGFSCLRANPGATRTNPCNFGAEFKGEFSGGALADQHLNITYGGGPYLLGEMGFSDITVSNITVAKQQIGLATQGMWRGDGITSGILGLGLPGLTDSFMGAPSEFLRDSLARVIQYNPLVNTIGKQIQPIFALALSRDPAKSFLSFGGIPAGTKVDGEWASTPIKKLKLRNGQSEYLYYQIGVDKVTWNGTASGRNKGNGTDTAPPDYIVDSGTTLNLMPYEVAQAINSAFNPPAVSDGSGQYMVRCNAKAPSMGVQIGGKMFWTDPASMILPESQNESGYCISGVGFTSSFPYILGDTFMQQLVTVFDISDKMEIRIAKRA